MFKQLQLQAYKVDLLKRACPADSVLDFGGMWGVQGKYAMLCKELGCKHVTIIDTLEVPEWNSVQGSTDGLTFLKGDFADPFFMANLSETCDLSIAYSIMLHQKNLLDVLGSILERTRETFCFCQPMLRESETSQSLIFLPGHPDEQSLHPYPGQDTASIFQSQHLTHNFWIWGMTPSFMRAALECYGFIISYEEEFEDLPNPRWFWWCCIATRR